MDKIEPMSIAFIPKQQNGWSYFYGVVFQVQIHTNEILWHTFLALVVDSVWKKHTLFWKCPCGSRRQCWIRWHNQTIRFAAPRLIVHCPLVCCSVRYSAFCLFFLIISIYPMLNIDLYFLILSNLCRSTQSSARWVKWNNEIQWKHHLQDKFALQMLSINFKESNTRSGWFFLWNFIFTALSLSF